MATRYPRLPADPVDPAADTAAADTSISADTNTGTDTVVASEPNPAEPVGTPPGGGTWTWDAAAQAWSRVDLPPAA